MEGAFVLQTRKSSDLQGQFSADQVIKALQWSMSEALQISGVYRAVSLQSNSTGVFTRGLCEKICIRSNKMIKQQPSETKPITKNSLQHMSRLILRLIYTKL